MSTESQKVFIAPVGYEEKKLRKALVKSGVERFYLIKEKKPGYNEIAQEIIDSFVEEFGYVWGKENFNTGFEADFLDMEDTLAVLTKAIEIERLRNEGVDITIDLSSTTKIALIAASLLNRLYGVGISWVSDNLNYLLSGEFTPRTDPGGDYKSVKGPKKRLDEKGRSALIKILQHGKYKRLKDFATDMAKERGMEDYDVALHKACGRLLYKLSRQNLVDISEDGSKKVIDLTKFGRGIARGIQEAREYYRSSVRLD